MADYTSKGLIDNVKRRALIPTSQNTFTNPRLAAILNDELQATIVPLIMSVREEHFVATKDVTIVGQQNAYDIPADAIGMKLRDIQILDENSNAVIGSLSRLQPEDVVGTWNFATPTGFFIQSNQVILYPTPQASGKIRLTYFKRSADLVDTSEAGKITNISVVTNEVTLASLPSGWAVGDTVDCVNAQPPFNTPATSITVTAINGFVLTLSDVTGMSVGNWICQSGSTVVPYIPIECQHVLCQAAAVKVLEGLGDAEGMNLAQSKLNEMVKNMLTILNPRVDGEPKKVNSAGRSLADSMRFTRRWGY